MLWDFNSISDTVKYIFDNNQDLYQKTYYYLTYANSNNWKYNKDKERFELELNVAGYSKKEIEVIKDDNYLKIVCNSDKYGSKDFKYLLPNNIEKIKIELENGILLVYGYLSENKKPKKIEWD